MRESNKRMALEAAKGLLFDIEGQIDELQRKRQSVRDFIDILEYGASSMVDLLEMLKREIKVHQRFNIADAAIFMARNLPDNIITTSHAKEMIVEGLSLGTPNAVNSYFSRSKDFENIGRGKYRLINRDGAHASVPGSDQGDAQSIS